MNKPNFGGSGFDPEDLLNFLKKLRDNRVVGSDDKKPLKTFAMKPAWKKAYEELIKSREDHDHAEKKAAAKHRAFWALIETETECYEKMHYNEETGEIEVYKD